MKPLPPVRSTRVIVDIEREQVIAWYCIELYDGFSIFNGAIAIEICAEEILPSG